MRRLRSWPAGELPAGRAHVVDDLERLVIADYDYSPLGEVDDDVLLLEWDVAVDPYDLNLFEARALAAPDRVRVLAYRLHAHRPGWVWAHRRIRRDGQGERFVNRADLTCHLPAWGCIYLPRALVRAFLAAPAPARGRDPRLPPQAPYDDVRLTDQTFGIWHHFHQAGPPVPIDWALSAVHLHT